MDLDRKHFRRGLTIAGQRILLDSTSEQNWVRIAISYQNARLNNLAQTGDDEHAARVVTIAEALVKNLGAPVHYAGNRPGAFSAAGLPLLPTPRFTYFDLWSFGVSGEAGLAGFLRECGLPAITTHHDLLVTVGLLLVADAVSELDEGNESLAGFLLGQAAECIETAVVASVDGAPPDAIERALRDRFSRWGRHAGLASGKARSQSKKHADIREAACKLQREGAAKSEVASKLGTRFELTPGQIRRVLNKQA